ncbi:MAG: hypothetical protein L3J57_13985 [Desulfuromusa sp.]|nr:hypothetical protein [Desulfuromusa sp.]
MFRSPLNGVTQTLELPGARWAADISFAKMTDGNKRILSAFLVALRGQAGRFYLSDPTNQTPAGSVNGAPVIDTAVSDTPTLIGSSGWTVSAIGVLKAGDMIGFATGELKMVVADVDADASGQAIIHVEPPCREQPTDGTTIVTDAPTCIMRLVDDNQASWNASPPKRYIFSLSCEEAIV